MLNHVVNEAIDIYEAVAALNCLQCFCVMSALIRVA